MWLECLKFVSFGKNGPVNRILIHSSAAAQKMTALLLNASCPFDYKNTHGMLITQVQIKKLYISRCHEKVSRVLFLASHKSGPWDYLPLTSRTALCVHFASRKSQRTSELLIQFRITRTIQFRNTFLLMPCFRLLTCIVKQLCSCVYSP